MKYRKLITVVLTVILCFSAFGTTAFAATAHSEIDYGYPFLDGWNGSDYNTYLEDYVKPIFHNAGLNGSAYHYGNEESQNYRSQRTIATVINAYVSNASGNIMTVQATQDGKIGIEYYKQDGTFIRNLLIKQELPIWGGFYDDGKNYYILTGRENEKESDSVEVMRVTKYDQNWKKLGSCGLYGANTTIPFDFGTARMCHDGKYLIVRTCHLMYKHTDGVNHQANLTFEVDTDAMKVTDSYTVMVDSTHGYTSHSLNQFVQIENHCLAAVDHTDSSPARGVLLINYDGTVSDGTFVEKCTYSVMMAASGTYEQDNDFTEVSVGGFEVSSKAYIVAGTRSNDLYNPTDRSIVVSTKNKSTGKITEKAIASYTNALPSNPHLVKLSTDSYLLMWGLDNVVHYVKLDADGNKVGKEYSFSGNLSDCKPVLINGNLIWYVRNYIGIYLYRISVSDMKGGRLSFTPYQSSEWMLYKNSLVWVDKNGDVDTGYRLTWKSNNKGKWVEYSGKLLNSKDLTYKNEYGNAMNAPASQWLRIDKKWYYFTRNGYMAHREWINGYWINPNGTWTYKHKGSWNYTGKGWMYTDTSGWKAASWSRIDGKWYYFNTDGIMQTGWLKSGTIWYYLNTNGAMQTGWKMLSGKWYYFNSVGIMATGTKTINGKTYEFSAGGVCLNPY